MSEPNESEKIAPQKRDQDWLDAMRKSAKESSSSVEEDKAYRWETILIAEDDSIHVSFNEHKLNGDGSGRFVVQPGDARYDEILARHQGAVEGTVHAAMLPPSGGDMFEFTGTRPEPIKIDEL